MMREVTVPDTDNFRGVCPISNRANVNDCGGKLCLNRFSRIRGGKFFHVSTVRNGLRIPDLKIDKRE